VKLNDLVLPLPLTQPLSLPRPVPLPNACHVRLSKHTPALLHPPPAPLQELSEYLGLVKLIDLALPLPFIICMACAPK
jgi:hypothetical protein